MVLVISNFITKATECVDRIFQEEKVNLYLCQNYSNYKETTTLLFKARTKILNDYIKLKIKVGLLEDKKFEIQIYDQLLTFSHLVLTKGKTGYFVDVSGFPTIQQLTTFVNYFTHDNWKPFITGDYRKITDEIISMKIDKFFLDYSSNDFESLRQDTLVVWKMNKLRLDYYGDNLKYFIGNLPLAIKTTSSIPILIHDRFILFQSDSIFVLEGQNIIRRIEIDQPITRDYDNYSFSNWINICEGGLDNWIYSYSYVNNKFHKRPK